MCLFILLVSRDLKAPQGHLKPPQGHLKSHKVISNHTKVE